MCDFVFNCPKQLTCIVVIAIIVNESMTISQMSCCGGARVVSFTLSACTVSLVPVLPWLNEGYDDEHAPRKGGKVICGPTNTPHSLFFYSNHHCGCDCHCPCHCIFASGLFVCESSSVAVSNSYFDDDGGGGDNNNWDKYNRMAPVLLLL